MFYGHCGSVKYAPALRWVLPAGPDVLLPTVVCVCVASAWAGVNTQRYSLDWWLWHATGEKRFSAMANKMLTSLFDTNLLAKRQKTRATAP